MYSWEFWGQVFWVKNNWRNAQKSGKWRDLYEYLHN